MKTDTTTKPPEAPDSERVGDCSVTSCSAPVYPCWLYDHQLNFWWRCSGYPESIDVSKHNAYWMPDGEKPNFKPNSKRSHSEAVDSRES